jgi:hypothetical protein
LLSALRSFSIASCRNYPRLRSPSLAPEFSTALAAHAK